MTESGTRKVINNTAWLYGDKLVHAIVGLFVGLWVARHLGPEQYGWLSYAIAFVGFFDAFARVGLDHVAIKLLVENPEKAPSILGTSFKLRWIFSLLAFVVCISGLILFKPDPMVIVLMGSILASGMFFQTFDVADHLFQSQVKVKYTVIAKKSAYLISSGLKIFLILSDADLIFFALAILLEMLLAVPLFLHFIKKVGIPIRSWTSDAQLQKELLKQSYPLMFSAWLAFIYLRIDQIMIGELINAEELGKYAASVRISEMWYVLPMSIVASVFPSVVKTYNRNQSEFTDRLKVLLSALFWFPLLVAILLSFFAEPLMQLLYGNAYGGAGNALAVQVWAAIFVGFNSISYRYYVLIKKTKALFVRSLIGVVINVLLNFALIPKMGITGAAVATLASQFSVGWLFNAGAAPELFKLQSNVLRLSSLKRAINFVRELLQNKPNV